MASTAFQVVSQVVAALMDQTTAKDRVYLNLEAALEREESPAIIIEQASDNSESYATNMDKNSLKFKVLFLARSDDWQTELDEVRETAHQIITTDPVLSTLVLGLRRTSMEAGAKSADLPLGYISQQYIGQYISPITQLNGETSGF